jgi:hypothetical protein
VILLLLAAAGAPLAAAAPASPPLRTLASPRPIPPAELASDTLAWVGDRAVTALDLVQRIEWMPWPEKHNPASLDSARVKALQSLVAEQLLAGEAERLGLGGPVVFGMREALRRALARDALYHEVVKDSTRPDFARVEAIVRREYPRARPSDRPALRHMVADSLRQLAESRRGDEFLGRLLGGERVVVDSAVFMRFSDSLRSVMLEVKASGAPVTGRPIPSEASDVLRLRLAADLARPIAHLPDGPLSLGDVLEDMRFYEFHVSTLQRQRFAQEMSGNLRAVVEGEAAAREALRRGLDRRPEVRHDLEMWSAAWGSNLALARIPHDRVNAHVAELAERASPRMRYPALRRVEILPANMVVKRFLGFGGGMLAAPSLAPQWEWVPLWRATMKPRP